jgi:type IV secretion system protein VirD4
MAFPFGQKDWVYQGCAWNPERKAAPGRMMSYDLDSVAHGTIMATTGAGKGAGVEIPNLCMNGLKRVNVLSQDPTGQNAKVSWRWRSTFSDVEFLNPEGLHDLPDSGCNPLLSVESMPHAMAVGEAFEEVRPDAREPFFSESTQKLIGAVVLGVCRGARANKQGPKLETVVKILMTDIEGFASAMALSGDYELQGLLARYAPKDGVETNRTIEAIKQTAHNAAAWALSASMRKSLSVEKGIDWTKLKHGKRPMTVYLILPADKLGPSIGAPWLKLMNISALNTLYRLGGGGPRKTLFMLSEFAAIGRLQAVITGLTQARKYQVRFLLVLQDTGQLESIYGKAAASTVIGNTGALLAFAPAPADNGTAEFLSLTGGTEWAAEPSVSDDPHDGRARVNYSLRERRIWSPDMVRSLPEYHGLAWRGGNARAQPVVCPPYFTGELDHWIGGRYDPDPYHPSAAAPKKAAPGRRVTGIAALSAMAIAGGVWLANASPHGQIWHPHGAPVVRADPPKENPPRHGSPRPRREARR